MTYLRQTAVACCAALLACAAHAGTFTPKAQLDQLFTLEGDTPFPSPYAGTLNFSALSSKYDSGHGHGYRNELKVADRQRLAAAQTREHFSARVTPTLAAGAKTIVAQYHVEGLDTILKVYVQDTADAKGLDGKAGNGVFDIIVRILGTEGKEVSTSLGTLRSGESFALDIAFDQGEATVSATTAAHGERHTERTRIKADDRQIYFKFGDYLQALDLETGKHTISKEKWDQYYAQLHMDRSQVSFSQTVFERGGQP